MNPLDKKEFEFLVERIKADMPLITSSTMSIKRNFSQGMPKNMSDYHVKVNNQFLNDNLGVIEEIKHRDSKHFLPKWFKEYQNDNYNKDDILNKDSFFNDFYFEHDNRIYPKVSGGSFVTGLGLSFSNAVLNRSPIGADIETNDGTGGSAASRGINVIELAKFPNTGIAGALYDRLAYHGSNTVGNIEMGVYAEDTPNARLTVTGSIAAETSYAWHSVTEFSLTHTQNWFAWNNDTGAEWYWKTDTTKTKAVTFGSMPNPAGGSYTDTTTEIQGKMGHS